MESAKSDYDMQKRIDEVSASLGSNGRVLVRPSGTEPKIKAYITAIGKDKESAQVIADRLIAEANEIMK